MENAEDFWKQLTALQQEFIIQKAICSCVAILSKSGRSDLGQNVMELEWKGMGMEYFIWPG